MKRLFLLAFVFLSFSANAADVTLYPDCDFRGQAISVAPGDYTARELLNLGIPQDAISSIEVPRGLAVTVYEDDNFKGRYGTLRRSDPCLVNDRFDNIISSISIRETLDTLLQPVPEPTAQKNLVTVYTECEYRGRSASFDVGSYNYSSLNELGIPNNSISSVKVPKGYSITLYDHDFLRGKGGRLQRDDACLQNDRFDDITSSIEVERIGPIEESAPAAPAKPVVDTAPVLVFTQCNYGGSKLPLKEGKYTSSDLANLGIKNNSISSIRVQNGYQIELFENDFYRGRSGTLRQNDACLVDDRFNDLISSVVVSKNPYAEEQVDDAPKVATVFGYCNFKGGSVDLAVGKYDLKALAKLGISDNKISSIKVRQGYQATVYDNADFSGRQVTLTEKDDCLDNEGLDDALSALVIEKVPEQQDDAFSNLDRPTQQSAQVQQMDTALICLQEYVEKDVCDSHRWRGMVKRCELNNIELMMDGYLKGHIDAGNCTAELWNELARRVANPRLR